MCSLEPMLFAHVSGRQCRNLSQRTRHMASLRVRGKALKDSFRGISYDEALLLLLLLLLLQLQPKMFHITLHEK